MTDWRSTELGSVLTLQRGFDITKRTQRPGAVPIVSSSGINSFHDESRVDRPGVVIGRKGSLGTAYFVRAPHWPHDTTLWVRDFQGNDPYYCYLLLRSLPLAELDAGSSNPTLNRNHAHRLPVVVPDLASQRRVSALAQGCEELIEINERRIELLEDLARSIYREWFVRFRFPDHANAAFVQSPAGLLPERWSLRPLNQVAEIRRRTTNPPNMPAAIFEHYSIPAFDDGGLPRIEPGSEIRSGKYALEGTSVLLSKLNPRIPRVWYACPETSMAVASTEFLVWTGTSVSNSWLWSYFSTESFRERLVAVAAGTSTSHQRVKPDQVAQEAVCVAEANLLRAFDAVAEPALEAAVALRRQNHGLRTTSDLLLPRLVTGRLDISDIDLGDLLPADAA